MKTVNTPTVELNPCDCGRAPFLHRWHDGHKWVVICLKCTTTAKPYEFFIDAANAWNEAHPKH